MGVKTAFVVDVTLLCVNIGFLGKDGMFSGSGACCVIMDGTDNMTPSSIVGAGNCRMNAIADIGCSCGDPDEVILSLQIGNSLHVPGKDHTCLMGRLLNKIDMSLHLDRGASCCVTNSAVRDNVTRKLAKRVRGIVLPRMGTLIPGVSDLVATLAALMSGPTLARALKGMRALDRGLDCATSRLGGLFRGRLPRLVDDLRNADRGLGRVATSLDRVSCARALTHMSDAVGGLRTLSTTLVDSRDDMKGLVGSATFCRGLGGIYAGTGTLVGSIGTRPSHCVDVSMFKGGG